MSRRSLIIFFAGLVVVVPLLGFPGSWEDAFLVIAGVSITLIMYFSDTTYCNSCQEMLETDIALHRKEEKSEHENEQEDLRHEDDERILKSDNSEEAVGKDIKHNKTQ